MRKLLLILALCISACAQNYVVQQTGSNPLFKTATWFDLTTNPSQSIVSYVVSINASAGTATLVYAYTINGITTGDTIKIVGTGTCYDGNHAGVTVSGFNVSFTSACTATYEYQYQQSGPMQTIGSTTYALYVDGNLDVSPVTVAYMRRSTNAGTTWDGPTAILTTGYCAPATSCGPAFVTMGKTPDGTKLLTVFMRNTLGVGIDGLFTATSTDGVTWTTPTQLTSSNLPSGIGTSVYLGANVFTAPNGRATFHLSNNGGTGGINPNNWLIQSCDGGLTWAQSSCSNSVLPIKTSGGAWVNLPTTEDAFITVPAPRRPSRDGPNLSNAIIGFGRGALASINPPQKLWFTYSLDGGATWAAAVRTNFAFENTPSGTATVGNQISPYLLSSVSGQATLLFAERSQGLYNYIRALTFDSGLAVSSNGVFPTAQIITSNAQGPDCGYPTAAMTSTNTLALQYHCQTDPSEIDAIYTLEGRFLGFALANGGNFSGALSN